MHRKSLTKWTKWVSDRKRAVWVKEDEATWVLQLTTKLRRERAGRYWSTRLTMSIQSFTLTINARWYFFLLSCSSVIFSITSLGAKWQKCPQLPFFPLTCTTFSGTTLYFANTPVLIYALRRAPGSENNGSARHVEPNVFRTIKMFFFWIG